jgi:hypothetical protein
MPGGIQENPPRIHLLKNPENRSFGLAQRFSAAIQGITATGFSR